MKNRFRFDFPMLLVTLALVGFGIVMVYSSSAVLAKEKFNDSLYFLKKQVVFSAVGIVLMFVIMSIDYHIWRRFAYPILGLGFCLLMLVLVAGVRAGGSTRWLNLGFISFQPSEFSKLALVVFLSYFLSKKGEKIKTFQFGFLPTMLISGLMILLVIRQPDFGVAVLLAIMVIVLLFVGGTKLFYIISTAFMAVPAVYFLIVRVPYRFHRFMSFLNPWDDPTGTSFQIIQSFLAFGSGGLFGLGLGQGKQKLFFLPAPHTDFVFSIVGEEIGFIGAIIILGLYVVFTVRGFRVSLGASDEFGTYLGLGTTCLISLQAIINMAVVLGLLPTKGLTLPFISYGGTSVVMSLLAVGILLNISSQLRPPEVE